MIGFDSQGVRVPPTAPIQEIEMEMNWINVKEALPIDFWEQQFPSDNNYKNIMGEYLVVMVDQDPDGKIWDEAVVAVNYHGDLGWTYYAKELTKHLRAHDITKWMPFPEP